MVKKVFLIDALSPFFAGCDAAAEYNWSKVPFSLIEDGPALKQQQVNLIVDAFDTYAARVAALGFTAVAIDDMAHIVVHSFYRPSLRSKLEQYQVLYHRLFDCAARCGLEVYLTTDVMFLNEDIARYSRMRLAALLRVFASSVRKLFRDFPGVAGVVVRIGESDGIDVQGDFKSRLMVRTPAQCRRFLRALLPIFEKHDRQLVFRTWSLGAFPLGDLMWNRVTYERVFGGIDSDHLIISQKYGESDFFRHQNFNRRFFDATHRKIIELQARREYEGFGEFPAYVGNEYERFARYLSMCENVVGASVWCQTGGWSHFSRLTFGRGSSLWNEINTFVSSAIFIRGATSHEALSAWLARYRPGKDPARLIELMRIADRLVRELWYLPEFSTRRLYFRRTRVPPLLWVFWDTIIINHTMRAVLRRFVHERREAVQDGYRHLQRFDRLLELAGELELEPRSIEYMRDTFKLIAMSREFFFGRADGAIQKRIRDEVHLYRARYPAGFHVACDFAPPPLRKWLIKTIFKISIRRQPAYRLFDRLFLLRFAALVYPLFYVWQKKRIPAFAREQAMGLHVLFK